VRVLQCPGNPITENMLGTVRSSWLQPEASSAPYADEVSVSLFTGHLSEAIYGDHFAAAERISQILREEIARTNELPDDRTGTKTTFIADESDNESDARSNDDDDDDKEFDTIASVHVTQASTEAALQYDIDSDVKITIDSPKFDARHSPPHSPHSPHSPHTSTLYEPPTTTTDRAKRSPRHLHMRPLVAGSPHHTDDEFDSSRKSPTRHNLQSHHHKQSHGTGTGVRGRSGSTPRYRLEDMLKLPGGLLTFNHLRPLIPLFEKGLIGYTDVLPLFSDGEPRRIIGDTIRSLLSLIKTNRFAKLRWLNPACDILESIETVGDGRFLIKLSDKIAVSTPRQKKWVLESKSSRMFTAMIYLTTHYSHHSLLTTHYSLLTTHYSLLTTHHSPLATHLYPCYCHCCSLSSCVFACSVLSQMMHSVLAAPRTNLFKPQAAPILLHYILQSICL
jgi:hypothetical protein